MITLRISRDIAQKASKNVRRHFESISKLYSTNTDVQNDGMTEPQHRSEHVNRVIFAGKVERGYCTKTKGIKMYMGTYLYLTVQVKANNKSHEAMQMLSTIKKDMNIQVIGKLHQVRLAKLVDENESRIVKTYLATYILADTVEIFSKDEASEKIKQRIKYWTEHGYAPGTTKIIGNL